MGLFDTILGRSKPVRANLDALFALPTAALTLQSAGGLVSSGHAGVCWKPPPGQAAADAQKEIAELVGDDDFRYAQDKFDYGWLLLDDGDLEELVTKIHMANSTLQDNGWGPQLLCSAFGFVPGPDAPSDARAFRLVYLFKRGPSTRSRPWTRRRSGGTPSSSCAFGPWSEPTCRWKPISPAGSPCGTCRSPDVLSPGVRGRDRAGRSGVQTAAWRRAEIRGGALTW